MYCFGIRVGRFLLKEEKAVKKQKRNSSQRDENSDDYRYMSMCHLNFSDK